MKFYATLLLAAIHTAAFVEADAFVSTPAAAVPSRGQGYAKVPLTKARSSHQRGVAVTSALRMSGGGGGGEAVSTEGTATIPDEVFNLVKSIVGAGVLSLPAGEYQNVSLMHVANWITLCLVSPTTMSCKHTTTSQELLPLVTLLVPSFRLLS